MNSSRKVTQSPGTNNVRSQKPPTVSQDFSKLTIYLDFNAQTAHRALKKLGAKVTKNWNDKINYFVTDTPEEYQHWIQAGPIVENTPGSPSNPMASSSGRNGIQGRRLAQYVANANNQASIHRKRLKSNCEQAAERRVPCWALEDLNYVLDRRCPSKSRRHVNTDPHFLDTKHPYIALSDTNGEFDTIFKEFKPDKHGNPTHPRLYLENNPDISCPFSNPNKKAKEKHKKNVKEKDPFIHGGFCENCQLEFEDLHEHVKKVKHRRKVENSLRYLELDRFFEDINRDAVISQKEQEQENGNAKSSVSSSTTAEEISGKPPLRPPVPNLPLLKPIGRVKIPDFMPKTPMSGSTTGRTPKMQKTPKMAKTPKTLRTPKTPRTPKSPRTPKTSKLKTPKSKTRPKKAQLQTPKPALKASKSKPLKTPKSPILQSSSSKSANLQTSSTNPVPNLATSSRPISDSPNSGRMIRVSTLRIPPCLPCKESDKTCFGGHPCNECSRKDLGSSTCISARKNEVTQHSTQMCEPTELRFDDEESPIIETIPLAISNPAPIAKPTAAYVELSDRSLSLSPVSVNRSGKQVAPSSKHEVLSDCELEQPALPSTSNSGGPAHSRLLLNAPNPKKRRRLRRMRSLEGDSLHSLSDEESDVLRDLEKLESCEHMRPKSSVENVHNVDDIGGPEEATNNLNEKTVILIEASDLLQEELTENPSDSPKLKKHEVTMEQVSEIQITENQVHDGEMGSDNDLDLLASNEPIVNDRLGEDIHVNAPDLGNPDMGDHVMNDPDMNDHVMSDIMNDGLSNDQCTNGISVAVSVTETQPAPRSPHRRSRRVSRHASSRRPARQRKRKSLGHARKYVPARSRLPKTLAESQDLKAESQDIKLTQHSPRVDAAKQLEDCDVFTSQFTVEGVGEHELLESPEGNDGEKSPMVYHKNDTVEVFYLNEWQHGRVREVTTTELRAARYYIKVNTGTKSTLEWFDEDNIVASGTHDLGEPPKSRQTSPQKPDQEKEGAPKESPIKIETLNRPGVERETSEKEPAEHAEDDSKTSRQNNMKPKSHVSSSKAPSKPKPKSLVSSSKTPSKPNPKSLVSSSKAPSKQKPNSLVSSSKTQSKPKPKSLVCSSKTPNKPKPKAPAKTAKTSSKPKPKRLAKTAKIPHKRRRRKSSVYTPKKSKRIKKPKLSDATGTARMRKTMIKREPESQEVQQTKGGTGNSKKVQKKRGRKRKVDTDSLCVQARVEAPEISVSQSLDESQSTQKRKRRRNIALSPRRSMRICSSQRSQEEQELSMDFFREMFPEIPMSTIKKSYEKNNHSRSDTCTDLLTA